MTAFSSCGEHCTALQSWLQRGPCGSDCIGFRQDYMTDKVNLNISRWKLLVNEAMLAGSQKNSTWSNASGSQKNKSAWVNVV